VRRLFVPGALPGSDTGRAYDALRARAAAWTGRPIRATRIYAVSCRREGSDSETRVGECDPCNGRTVQAIFATSEGCTVVFDRGFIDLSKRQIYETITFGS